MTTLELVKYYVNLLILQFHGKPKARATIATQVTPVIMPQTSTQAVVSTPTPDSGLFTLSYGGNISASIAWNDSATTIQTILQALPGLSAVTVSGTADNFLVTFTGVYPVAELLVLETNTLTSSSVPVVPVITETDITLPLAVQGAYNLVGSEQAVGVQLDVLGKYVGVTRTSPGFTTQITLDDVDFRTLIQIKTFENNAGSSTAEIVGLLNDFFPQQIYLFDHQNMEFDYYLSTAVGSMDLIQVFITQGLLPRPMTVRIRLIIYAPILDKFFGFRTYDAVAFNATPFNDYTDYQTDWPFLNYSNAIIPPP